MWQVFIVKYPPFSLFPIVYLLVFFQVLATLDLTVLSSVIVQTMNPVIGIPELVPMGVPTMDHWPTNGLDQLAKWVGPLYTPWNASVVRLCYETDWSASFLVKSFSVETCSLEQCDNYIELIRLSKQNPLWKSSFPPLTVITCTIII